LTASRAVIASAGDRGLKLTGLEAGPRGVFCWRFVATEQGYLEGDRISVMPKNPNPQDIGARLNNLAAQSVPILRDLFNEADARLAATGDNLREIAPAVRLAANALQTVADLLEGIVSEIEKEYP